MKPVAFDYASPETVAEAVRLLSANEGAKLISGGQSLIPIMAFRLSAPSLLVDLRKIPELNRIEIDGERVRLGARVRWVDIERSEALARAHPLLCAAIAHVAHYQIRNKGTVGGSVAHADPAAEMPTIAAVCDAEIEVVGADGPRTIAAGDFFLGPLQTSLLEDDVIVSIGLPAWPAGRKWAFEEFARRRGDFALAGVALFYDLDAAGRVAGAHVAAIGVAGRPQRLHAIEAALNGTLLDDAAFAAATDAAERTLDVSEDFHASAAYRLSLFCSLLEKALRHSRAR